MHKLQRRKAVGRQRGSEERVRDYLSCAVMDSGSGSGVDGKESISRSLRPSLDIIKRKRNKSNLESNGKSKKNRHKRSRSIGGGSRKKINTSAPESPVASSLPSTPQQRKLSRGRSFCSEPGTAKDTIIAITAEPATPGRSKKMGRTKSFNTGSQKLDVVSLFGKGNKSPDDRRRKVGVSAPKGTTRMTESERLRFIRSLSSSSSMRATPLRSASQVRSTEGGEGEGEEVGEAGEAGVPAVATVNQNYVKRKVTAKSTWEAKDGAEISINAGDVILVHSVDSAGWAEGEILPPGSVADSSDTKDSTEAAGSSESGTGAEKKEGEGEAQGTEAGAGKIGWFPLSVMLPPGRLENVPSGVSLVLNADPQSMRVVDDDSIVHSKQSNQANLQKLLEKRPEKKSLIDLNIVNDEEAEATPFVKAIEKKKIGDLLTNMFTGKRKNSLSKRSRKKKKKVGRNFFEPPGAAEEEAAEEDDTPETSEADVHDKEERGADEAEDDDGEEDEEEEEQEEEEVEEEQEEVQQSPLAKGVELFNSNPTKGIKFFMDENIDVVGNTPAAIAKFLYKFTLLNKEQLGDFLGSKGELNEQILDAVLSQLDFSSLEFDMGLRRFLYAFRLPGEESRAQKIDRLMLAFARKFYSQHVGGKIFADIDAVYVLSFSTVMLNTDLHNPSVKKKMSVEQFISQNRDVNGGGNFDEFFLRDLYRTIQEDEIRTKDEDVFSSAIFRGWTAHSMPLKSKKSKRRWAVVDESGFFILKDGFSTSPLVVIPYDSISYIKNLDTAKHELRMKLTNGDEHIFCGNSARNTRLWVAKVNLMRCRVGYLKVTQLEQEQALATSRSARNESLDAIVRETERSAPALSAPGLPASLAAAMLREDPTNPAKRKRLAMSQQL